MSLDTPKLVRNVYGNVSTVLVETLFLLSALSFVKRYVKCKCCGSENFIVIIKELKVTRIV